MVLRGAALVAHDAFEDLEELDGLDFQTRLFEHLAAHRVLERLAEFQRAAGERPPTLQRFLPALRHQNAVPPEDDRSDTDERPLRIPTVGLRNQYAPFTSSRARWISPPEVMNKVRPS